MYRSSLLTIIFLLGLLACVQKEECNHNQDVGNGDSGDAADGIDSGLPGDRDECDGIPDCVSVTSSDFLSLVAEAGETASFLCPETHPFLWDWGYEGEAGLEFTFIAAKDPTEEDPRTGIIIEIKRTVPATDPLKYRLYAACSTVTQDADILGSLNDTDDEEDSETIETVDADVTRETIDDEDETQPVTTVTTNVTRNTISSADDIAPGGVEFSYVGKQIWYYLTTLYDKTQAYRGTTYNWSYTNFFEDDFILQTPKNAWGATGEEYAFKNIDTCPDPDPSKCNSDFKLLVCETDNDCSLTGGTCKSVAATVTQIGGDPLKLCLRSQDVLWDEIYQVIVSGESLVDITTLNQTSQAPDGRFKTAIRNALTFLASTGRTMKIRLAIGHFVSMPGKPKDLLGYILEGAKQQPSSKITVYLGYYCSSISSMSMNHSKIVAADGKIALVGGQNMFADDYLAINPAFDMTLRVSGPAAYDAQAFATRLWKYIKESGRLDTFRYSWKYGESYKEETYAEIPPEVVRAEGFGGTQVFAVGRLGKGIADDSKQPIPHQSSDATFLAMIKAATQTIRIAQQDLIWGPAAAYDKEYWVWNRSWYNQPAMTLLVEALLKKPAVEVYVVVSNLYSKTGETRAGSYYNGFKVERVAEMFKWFLERNDKYNKLPADQKKEILCQKLHVANIRFGAGDTWQDEYQTPIALHAKTIIVDEQAFYVGSHNFYPMDLQEYGLVIDDPVLTQEYLEQFWNQLWDNSKRVAVCGNEDESQCMFK